MGKGAPKIIGETKLCNKGKKHDIVFMPKIPKFCGKTALIWILKCLNKVANALYWVYGIPIGHTESAYATRPVKSINSPLDTAVNPEWRLCIPRIAYRHLVVNALCNKELHLFTPV